MELNKEQIKGYIESIILSIIKDEDNYGYEILKSIKKISHNNFEIKEGTLYVVLKRLELQGLITSYWNDNGSGGGRRRYHKITEKGLEYLSIKKQEWIFFKEILDSVYKGC
ncbi:PadR family transcriptional regulator [Clostridium intestinale]|uniref:Transcriptional regulator, PadR family protein n=1 Tax=Clostridium intestinale URNW TaxID=1294142 RepID=U2PYR9_9CLOT|nr:PadR family transcriptional regulator [Clostridium intestinale]ERK31625.1 transcriptional regulator, PadR family protein [Clostridium intestinale URNW]